MKIGQEYHDPKTNEHYEIVELTNNLVFYYNDGYTDSKPFYSFMTKSSWEQLVRNKLELT